MPRIKQVTPSIDKHIHLPAELVARVELELFSELEGKVPFGAWQQFITKLIKEHFELAERRKALAEELAELCKGVLTDSSADPAPRILAELRALGYGRAVDVIEEFWS